MSNALTRSNIILRPSGYKTGTGAGDGVLYAQKPETAPLADLVFARNGTKNRVNSSGLIENIAADRPALVYDPATLAYRGLDVERAATNLLLRSEEFDNAGYWTTASNVAVTANATTAPNGTATADKLYELATTATHRLEVATVAGTTANLQYTLSVYAKASERNSIVLTMSNTAGTSLVRTIFLLSGAGSYGNAIIAGTGARSAAYIESVGSGWYRLVLVGTSSASDTGLLSVSIGLSTGDPTISYLGVLNSGAFIWGAQLEAGSQATSYIKTEGGTAARVADNPKKTGLTTLFNNDDRQGTIYGVIRRKKNRTNGSIVNLTKASASLTERVYIRATGGDKLEAVVETPGTSRTNLLLQSQDFATTWSNNSSTESVNVAIAPDGTVTADKIIVDNLAVAGDITQNPTVVSGTQYTYSVYAKAAEWSWLGISVSMITGTRLAWFNLANGTIGTVQSNITTTIEMIGNGWYRCSVTGTADNTTGRVRFYPTNQDSPTFTTGNGTSGILLWGAQLETGSVATPYIPTTTIAASSTISEVVRIPSINEVEGRQIYAFAWSPDEGCSFYLNGVKQGEVLTALPLTPPLLDELYIGHPTTPSTMNDNHIHQLLGHIPKRISNAEIEALSASLATIF